MVDSSIPARCLASQYARLRALDHDGVDAAEGEQVRQEQAGRTGADDADLSTVLNGHAGATT